VYSQQHQFSLSEMRDMDASNTYKQQLTMINLLPGN
jgi:hypothetical protein